VVTSGRSLLLLIERRRNALQHLASGRAFATAGSRLSLMAQRLDDVGLRLESACRAHVQRKNGLFRTSAARLTRLDLKRRLDQTAGSLISQVKRLQHGVEHVLQAKQHDLGGVAASLNAYSPLAALQRGYAIVRKENRQVVKSVRDIHVGEDVRVYLHHGELSCRIQGMKS
jgi:exodeoxyribonuclease VII large subunit